LTEYLLQHPAAVKLHGCEAYNYPTYTPFTHQRSSTIADGLVLDDPHPKVQERIASFGIELHLVKDPEIAPAMKDLFHKQGWAVEPSSAVTTAFVAQNLRELAKPVCVILTGQNIAWDDFSRLIAAA